MKLGGYGSPEALAEPAKAVDTVLPCFGSIDDDPPPPPPGTYDDSDDGDSIASDEAVTVRDIGASCIAGERALDDSATVRNIPACCIAGEVIRDRTGEFELGSEQETKLADEVSSAVEFLAQLAKEEVAKLLDALDACGSNSNVATPRGVSPEAVHFLNTLIVHIPDRPAALAALRQGALSTSAYGGKVSEFLIKRKHFRLGRVTTKGNWEEHFTRGDDKETTRRYFYNNATQVTQWNPPPEFEELADVICEEGEEDDF